MLGEPLAADRSDFHLVLGRFGQEACVLCRRFEGRDQCGSAVGGDAGRRGIGSRELVRRHEQLQDLQLLGVLGQLHDQRHVRQVGILAEGRLRDDVDLLLLDPALALRLDAGPVDAADAVELAALHRQHDLGGAGIAGHELDVGAEHVLVEVGEDIELAARAGAAERDRLLEEVLPGLHRRGVPGDADADRVGDGAEPGQLRAS